MENNTQTSGFPLGKTLPWLTILLLIIGGFVWYGNKSGEQDSIKIGVIASLTGTGAVRGESAQQGLMLALEKIKQSGVLKGREIELVYEDVPLNQPKSAPSALQKLVEVDKVTAIIGPMGSTVVMSVAATVDAVGVPIIVHTASALKATEGNNYLFRLWPTANNYASVILEGIKERGYKRITVLSATQENTIDLLTVLESQVASVGAEFVVLEQVAADVRDFRTQLTKIKVAQPDTLFLNLFEGQIGVAADQARKLGIAIPIFTNGVMSAVELAVNPTALEGAWFPRFSGYTDEAKQEFIARFGKEPGNPETAAAAHDALLALAQVIGKVGANPEEIKDALYQEEFIGSIGEFRFLPSGESDLKLDLREVRNGEIVVVK